MLFPTRVRRRPLRTTFADVLEDVLVDGDGLIETDYGEAARVKAAPGVYSDLSGVEAYVGPGSLTSAYAVEQEQQPERPADPLAAAKALVLEIRPDLSVRALSALRRNFAAANHPDRVPPKYRDAAEAAMALVNGAIDSALKAKRAK